MLIFLVYSTTALQLSLNFNFDKKLETLAIGRLEIYHDSRYYRKVGNNRTIIGEIFFNLCSVCSNGFDSRNADFVCRSMGYEKHRWFASHKKLKEIAKSFPVLFRISIPL